MWLSNVVPANIVLKPSRDPPLTAAVKALAGSLDDFRLKTPQHYSRKGLRGISGGSPDDFRRDNIDGSHGTFAEIMNRNINF